MSIYLRWLSDSSLVRRTLRGHSDAFGVLVERHLGAVHALAWSHTGSAVDADDIAQEAFLRAYTKLDTLRDADKFAAWISGIVRNLAADLRAKFQRTTPMNPQLLEALPAPAASPDDDEVYAIVREAVLALEGPAREVLSLHYFAQKPMKEVAEIQGVTPDAAFKRLQRAREALGKELLARVEQAPALKTRANARKNAILAALATAPVAWKAAAASGGVSMAAWAGGVALLTVAALGGAGYANREAITTMMKPFVPALVAEVAVAPTPDTVKATHALVNPAPAVAPPPAPPGRIYGHTYDLNSKPLAGVVVRAELIDWDEEDLPPGETFYREAQTDEHGAFELSGLRLGEYGVYGVGSGLADAGRANLTRQEPEIRVDAYLKPASPTSGVVVDASGAAVSGASVIPYFYEPMGPIHNHSATSVARMTTDASGRFGPQSYWPGSWIFRVLAPGFAPLITNSVQAGSDNNRFVLSRGGTVRGKVLGHETQQPMPAVKVMLRGNYPRETMSDLSGNFSFEQASVGENRLSIDSDGAVLTSGGEPFELAEGATQEVVLSVGGGGTISGRVLDKDTGAGIPGVRVSVGSNPPNGQPIRRDSLTDAEGGFFQTALPEGVYWTEALTAPGYLFNNEPDAEIHLQAGREVAVTIMMQRGITVSGRVTTAEGKPAAGVHVTARQSDEELNPINAFTDDNGSYTLAVPRDMTVAKLFAFDETRMSPPRTSLKIPAEGLKGVDFQLSIVGTARVEVELDLKAPGTDLAGQQLELSLQHELPGFVQQTLPVTHMGAHVFENVLPGRYQVSLQVRRQWQELARSSAFTVAEGQVVNGIRLSDMPSGKHGIRGIVVDREGTPIPDVLVSLPQFRRSLQHTDSAGRFEFAQLDAGETVIFARKEGYLNESEKSATQTPADLNGHAEEVRITLRKAANFYIRFFDAETGGAITGEILIGVCPLSKATDSQRMLQEIASTSEHSQIMLGANRVVEPMALEAEPGDWFCVVAATGYKLMGKRVTAGNDTVVEYALTRIGSIRGMVQDATGAPISGAMLSAWAPGQKPLTDNGRMAATSDIQGQFELTTIAPGAAVYITHPLYAMQGAVVPEAAPFDVVLTPGGVVEGTLSTRPSSGERVQVECRADFGNGLGAMLPPVPVAPDGSFRIEQVPPGSVLLTLLALPRNDASTLRASEVRRVRILSGSPDNQSNTLYKIPKECLVREGQVTRVTFNLADAIRPEDTPDEQGDSAVAEEEPTP